MKGEGCSSQSKRNARRQACTQHQVSAVLPGRKFGVSRRGECVTTSAAEAILNGLSTVLREVLNLNIQRKFRPSNLCRAGTNENLTSSHMCTVAWKKNPSGLEMGIILNIENAGGGDRMWDRNSTWDLRPPPLREPAGTPSCSPSCRFESCRIRPRSSMFYAVECDSCVTSLRD